MSDEGTPQGAGQNQELTQLQSSILMAFNLGVSYNQQSGGLKGITEVSSELGHNIYSNLSQVYGNKLEDDYLKANTEYFLQIALLGYIIPSVCAYEEDFKNRLLSLIERRALKTQEQMSRQGGPGGGGSIVTP